MTWKTLLISFIFSTFILNTFSIIKSAPDIRYFRRFKTTLTVPLYQKSGECNCQNGREKGPVRQNNDQLVFLLKRRTRICQSSKSPTFSLVTTVTPVSVTSPFRFPPSRTCKGCRQRTIPHQFRFLRHKCLDNSFLTSVRLAEELSNPHNKSCPLHPLRHCRSLRISFIRSKGLLLHY